MVNVDRFHVYGICLLKALKKMGKANGIRPSGQSDGDYVALCEQAKLSYGFLEKIV